MRPLGSEKGFHRGTEDVQEVPPMPPDSQGTGHLRSGDRHSRQSSWRALDVSPAVWGTPWPGVYLMLEKSKRPELAKVA